MSLTVTARNATELKDANTELVLNYLQIQIILQL